MRLGQTQVQLAGPVLELLGRLQAHLAPRVGVDLPEERQLDLPREDAVLPPGEGPGLGPVDAVLRERGHDVGGDADVEQELAGPAPLVQGEGRARPRQLGHAGPVARAGPGRRHADPDGAGPGGRGGGAGPGLDGPEPLGQGVHLPAQVVDLAPEGLGILASGRAGAERDGEQGGGEQQTRAHGGASRGRDRGPAGGRASARRAGELQGGS